MDKISQKSGGVGILKPKPIQFNFSQINNTFHGFNVTCDAF